MGEAVLNGVPFRIDPTSISWPFTVKTSSSKTIGGKVVQVFGTQLGDLTVSGTFGVGGQAEQREFLARMKKLGDNQMDRFPKVSPNPYRFSWPSRGWDFQVYLKRYSEPGGDSSVDERIDNISPRWTIVLFIASDNLNLKKVATDTFIDRLSDGIGWKQTRYNGPADFTEVGAALGETGATDVKTYLGQAFGIATSVPVGNLNADGSTGATPTATGPIENRSSFTEVTWANDFLKALGKPMTAENKVGIVAWEYMEGGHFHNSAKFNPLNTTQPMPGAGNTGSQGNIKVYTDYAQGLEATVKTINNGRYGVILAALDAGTSAEAIADAIGQTAWGTKNGVRAAIPRARKAVNG